MKQFFFMIALFVSPISLLGAQTLKKMIIEAAPESVSSVFTGSCASPQAGMIVFTDYDSRCTRRANCLAGIIIRKETSM